MKNRRKIAKIAKLLFKNSLTSGEIDIKKAGSILKSLTKKPVPDTIKVLKIYKRLIEIALSWEDILIETADRLALDKKLQSQLLLKTGAQKIKYRLNPKIITGAKITHGDWVWDASLDAKLKQLTVNS